MMAPKHGAGRRPAPFHFAIAAFAAIILVSGCTQRVESDGASVYSLQWWTVLLPIGAAFIGLAFGAYRFVNGFKFLGMASAIFGITVGVLGVPYVLIEQAVVDEVHFERTGGFVFSPVKFEAKFDDIRAARGLLKIDNGFRKTRRNYFLIFSLKDGSQKQIPLGDLLKAALPEIVRRCEERGIPVSGKDHFPGAQ